MSDRSRYALITAAMVVAALFIGSWVGMAWAYCLLWLSGIEAETGPLVFGGLFGLGGMIITALCRAEFMSVD